MEPIITTIMHGCIIYMKEFIFFHMYLPFDHPSHISQSSLNSILNNVGYYFNPWLVRAFVSQPR